MTSHYKTIGIVSLLLVGIIIGSNFHAPTALGSGVKDLATEYDNKSNEYWEKGRSERCKQVADLFYQIAHDEHFDRKTLIDEQINAYRKYNGNALTDCLLPPMQNTPQVTVSPSLP